MHQDANEKQRRARQPAERTDDLSVDALRKWITGYLSARTDVADAEVDAAEPFARLGLDSIGAAAMLRELGKILGRALSPTLVWEYPTPAALAHHLAGAEAAAPAAASAAPRSRGDDEPIALVGLACRFPGAPDAAAFWRLLHDGIDAITTVPPGRWSEEVLGADGVEPAERAKVCRGGFLPQIDGFDPLFFGISPREAFSMDPQQRLVLELVWEALADAGIPPSSLRESLTGVFAATIWTDYGILLHRGGPAALNQYTITGYHHAILANRISYLFGLQGPSFTIDSACSSGLVGVHLACSSLRRGESTLALVAAANLDVLPESALGVARFGALSPDGRCHTFDAQANGYVRGEGAAVLVLKTLSAAIVDGDPVYCVLRGSAVNNDGPSNGLTAPNPRAQEALLRQAYAQAGVSPAEVQYVEAHGTGTPLGDPIEARALGAVLGTGRPPEHPLLIGSAKTNVGHLEGAAGLVGLIKVALAIRHRQLPPSLHFTSPSPHIAFAALGLAVPTALGPWPAPGQRLTAGVSSFGLGGTNGHVVLQEWPAVPTELCVFSAPTRTALRAAVQARRAKLESDAGRTPLRALCAAAAQSTEPGGERLAVAARTHAELDSALSAFLRDEASRRVHGSGPVDAARGVVFVFPGQGAQWPGMALSLLQGEPAVRTTLQRCDEYVRKFLGWSLLAELTAPRAASRLGEIEVSLPAIIAIDIAIAAYYRSLGIEPAAVVGHSTGEIAAAHVAGALELEDTMRIICAYGRIIGRHSGRGSMALVGLPWEEAAQCLVGFEGRLFRAIQDSAAATVLAGEPAAVDAVLAALRQKGVFCRPVAMNVSPHCPLVDSLREELRDSLRGIRPRRSRIPLISEVTGAELDGAQLDPEHWVRNFGDPAFFSAAVDTLIGRGHRVFVDVGPHPITKHSVEANLRRAGATGLVLASLRSQEDARATLLETLGRLYALGAPLRLAELYPPVNEAAQPEDAWLLPLSARSPEALDAVVANYAELLQPGAAAAPLRDLVYTASVRQEHNPHRFAAVGRTREELGEVLRAAQATKGPTSHGLRGHVIAGGAPKLVFVFPGQGSQWLGMGRTLLGQEPVFAAALRACDQAIAAEAGFSVLAELGADPAASQLARIDVVQPLLFAMAVSLAALWRSWGVEPDAVVGHSMGEVAAAHVAGALSLADAAAIVCRRSRLLRRISGQGEMALVELSLSEAQEALSAYPERLSVAVSNSPRATVIAGEPSALAEVLAQLGEKGVFCRRVKVDVASHSPQVEPLREDLLAALSQLAPTAAGLPMYSTVTGARVAGPELLADYWAANLRQPVRFAAVMQTLLASGHGLLLEMSPHPILVPAMEELLQMGRRSGAAVGSLRRDQPERSTLLLALGALWIKGYAVAWDKQFPSGGRQVPLPPYPFQRQPYWLEVPASPPPGRPGRATAAADGHPLLGEAMTLSTKPSTHVWEATLDGHRLPWLADHRVQGAIVFPGTAYLEMAFSAGLVVFGKEPFLISDLALIEALVFAGPRAVPVQTVLTEEQPGRQRFQVASRVLGTGRGSFRVHARAVLRQLDRAQAPPPLELAALRGRLRPAKSLSVYSTLSAMGLEYGPAFQGLTELWLGEGEALGRVQWQPAAGASAAYQFHPALLDACLQVMAAALADRGETTPWVPVAIASLRLLQRPTDELFCHVRLSAAGAETAEQRCAELVLVDGSGAAVVVLSGLTLQRLAGGTHKRAQDDWFLELAWEQAQVPPPKRAAGRWLLLGGGELGLALHRALQAAGQSCVHAPEDSLSATRLRALLTESFAARPPTAVVHLGSVGVQEPLSAAALERALTSGYDSVLATVQTLVRMGYRDAPRLWLVTRGAQAVPGHEVRVMQAPLLGLGRVIALEHAELHCGRLDLDPAAPEDEPAALLAELLADDAEDEIALRGGERWVSRLVHRRPRMARREKLMPAQGRPFRLELDQPGELAHLVLRSAKRRPPGPGEVELEVEAAGLGSLDVMKAIGVLPATGDEPLALGDECAGRVVAVGSGVTTLQVGQEVVAVAPFCFGTHVTAPAQRVAPRPARLGATAAAAVPLSFMTALYGLVHRGRLRAGERVLIHSAAAGAGLAAVLLARRLGAEVFATASSADKRAWLRAQGVQHVLDAQTADFVRQVQQATGGDGVDLVLNAPSGVAIEVSLAVLAVDGRFVELGELGEPATDIEFAKDTSELRPPLEPAQLRRGLSYSTVDLAALAERRPERFAALLTQVMDLFTDGALKQFPVQAFPISRAADALRKMAQAQHFGKLVLTLTEPEVRIRVPAQPSLACDAQGSYLVTGGLGGLGLRVAGWLAEHGAGHLVLLGRSGVTSPAQAAAVAALTAKGVRVTVAKADAADRAQLGRLIAELAASAQPLRGVVHAAGVLDDGLLLQQTPARLRTVLAPKALGALHLHELTRELTLDFFVLYASGAGLLGTPGQGNYAAANTFLDALSHHRRTLGLPALSIDWGAFSEVGLAAAQDNRGARLASRGMRSLTPGEGLLALARLLEEGGAAQVGVVPLNLRQWAGFNQAAAASRRLSRLWTEQRAELIRPAAEQDLLTRLATTEPEARPALVEALLRAQAAQVLRIPESKLDRAAPLTSLGMDSLLGLELRNRIETVLGIQVSATLLWTYPTIAGLSAHLAAETRGDAPAESAPPADATDEVEDMSQDDLTRMIAEKFEALT